MSKPIICEKEAPMNPHICCRCRAHAAIRDYMVDLGVDFQYEGTMYFCNMCMRDVIDAIPDALSIKMLEDVQLEHMNDLMELEAEITEARLLKNRLSELGITITLPESFEAEQDESRDDGQISSEPDGHEFSIVEIDRATTERNREAIITGLGTITFG